jgi:hypothetical protein
MAIEDSDWGERERENEKQKTDIHLHRKTDGYTKNVTSVFDRASVIIKVIEQKLSSLKVLWLFDVPFFLRWGCAATRPFQVESCGRWQRWVV